MDKTKELPKFDEQSLSIDELERQTIATSLSVTQISEPDKVKHAITFNDMFSHAC